MSETEAAKLMDEGEKRLTKFAPFTSTEEKCEKAREKFLQAATNYKACLNWVGVGMAYKRAADMSQKIKSEVDLVDDLMNAGTAFRKSGDPRAEEVLNGVVDLYDKAGKYSQAAKVCTQIGDMGGETSDQWYKRAITYMRNEGSKITSHDVVKKMIAKMLEQGRFEAARIEYEKMGREHLDAHLTRGSAKTCLFNALLCTVAQVTAQSLVESTAVLEGRFQEYQDLDPQFTEHTREFMLIKDLIQAFNDDNYDGYTDAVAEFENVMPLDTVRMKLVLRGKNALRKGGGAKNLLEDDTN